MQVTIDRQRWARGREGGLLLRSCDGKMCALGFIYRAAGIEKKEIEDMPGLDREVEPEELQPLRMNSRIDIADANDSIEDSDEFRESIIKDAASRGGICITFIN